LAVLNLKSLTSLLEKRPLQYLGKTSFALYLVHFTVMSSLASYIFYRLVPEIGYKGGLLITCVISLSVTFLVASAFTRYVDVTAISISKRIGNWLVSGDSLMPSFTPLRWPRPIKIFNHLRPQPLPQTLPQTLPQPLATNLSGQDID
jgi:peptidoglycan/LPS O-acetylase OafA/YrhL